MEAIWQKLELTEVQKNKPSRWKKVGDPLYKWDGSPAVTTARGIPFDGGAPQ